MIDKHGGALEADLIDMGMRLRDFPSERHTWRDLRVIVQHARPDSRVYSAEYPEHAGLTRQTTLIGQAVDALNLLYWAKTKDGRKNRNRPKSVLPIKKRTRTSRNQERPGSAPSPSPLSKIKERIPTRALPTRERQQRLGRLFGR